MNTTYLQVHTSQRQVTLMARERIASFDSQTFLAIVGSGTTILKVKKNQVFFSQAEFN
jgi:hypothetical protein